MSKKSIAVAMSGGVDSSIAGAILKQRGQKVCGIFMKIWNEENLCKQESKRKHACYGPGELEDIRDAEETAKKLDIPFYVFDLRDKYESEVLDYFRKEYKEGRTPNPCTVCNKKIKFGELFKRAKESNVAFDYLATGHYVRHYYDKERNRHILKRAVNTNKDQSYFLYGLSQKQLSCSLFPLGSLSKKDVRNKAYELGLRVYDKPESQDFFSGDYNSLIPETRGSGPILNRKGIQLGEHSGIHNFTVGQRKGIGLSSAEPLYVVEIDRSRNALIVGSEEEIYQSQLKASHVNWIAIKELKSEMEAIAKIRYHHPGAHCNLIPDERGKVIIEFKEPQRAVAPGQAVVFYIGETVLGGGVIKN